MGWLSEKIKASLKQQPKTSEQLPRDYHKRTAARQESYEKEQIRIAKAEGRAQARSEYQRKRNKSGGSMGALKKFGAGMARTADLMTADSGMFPKQRRTLPRHRTTHKKTHRRKKHKNEVDSWPYL